MSQIEIPRVVRRQLESLQKRVDVLEAETKKLKDGLRPFAEAHRKGGDFYSVADRIDGTHFARAAELVPAEAEGGG